MAFTNGTKQKLNNQFLRLQVCRPLYMPLQIANIFYLIHNIVNAFT